MGLAAYCLGEFRSQHIKIIIARVCIASRDIGHLLLDPSGYVTASHVGSPRTVQDWVSSKVYKHLSGL